MLKLLFIFILALLPSFGLAQNTSFSENTPVLRAKLETKSEESDEFLTYWRNDFRKDEQGNLIAICDIKRNDYTVMYSKYSSLTASDRDIVNATPDYEEGYTIKDSVVELIRLYGSKKPNSDENKRTLNQSSTITIIVAIAVLV